GVKILSTKTNEGCVKAFTPLSFGIKLNEPAQCKVDYNRTNSFDEMTYFFGGDSLFEYNHSMTLRLPSPDSINAEVPQLMNDGTYNLYVKCQDGNSNSNDDLFVFSFCVEKGPDVTPPIIEATSIENGAPFQYELDSLELEIYINEPAECKWSKTDQDYENMETDFSCSSHVWEMNSLMLYKCTTTLTGLKNKEENKFYFKCKDQPILTGEKANDRNTNVESYEFVLIGTQPLDIMEVSPNGTIKGASSPTPIFLEVKTDNGYNFGDAWCYYSLTENTDDYIQFFETGTSTHKQRLDLPEGDYTYYFSCTDKGGNTAQNQTSFSTKIDVSPPEVVRAYKDSDKLKIITDEKSSCSYQTNDEKKCNFILTEATNMPYTNSTEHVAEWLENKNYYIKCVDINGREPLPTECSIVVKPSDV
ncbi:MAG: hypothetical protein KJ559_02765, partial [Nanoarchaeota archaeon]|nr:hypothetical protein [Nanoarchaeota archaeon]